MDPSRGDCRCLYEPVTEVRLFPDYFKIISPIRFKFKRHQNLLGAERRRRVPAGCAAPAGALCCHLLPRPGTGIPPNHRAPPTIPGNHSSRDAEPPISLLRTIANKGIFMSLSQEGDLSYFPSMLLSCPAGRGIPSRACSYG